jgi:polar amino acid transport system substrate-binding protein
MKLFKHVFLVLISTVIIACSPKSEDTLIVGTTTDNPPYAFMDKGKIVGLDVDVANAIGYHLGKKVVIKPIEFHKIFSAVSTGKVDIAIAGLSVTPDRTQRVDFSDTYTNAVVAVLFRKSDNIEKELDLKGKVIGAKLGTVLGQVAQDLAIKLESRVRTLDDNNKLVNELKKKIVDVVIIEEAQANSYSIQNPELSYFIMEDLSSDFAIAIKKNSPLKISVDNAIRVLETEGVFNNIRQKWLIKRPSLEN